MILKKNIKTCSMKSQYFKFQILKKYHVLYFFVALSLVSSCYLIHSHKASQNRYAVLVSFLENSESETKNYEYKMSKALQDKKYDEYLENKILMNIFLLENGYYNGLESKNMLQNEINFDKYLLKHQIQPLNFLLEYNHIGEVNGVTAIYEIIKEILPLILPLLTLLITTVSVIEDKKVSIFLLSLPIKKKTHRKFQLFSSIVVSFFIIVFLLVVSFIVGCVLGGTGDFSYPITINTSMLNLKLIDNYLYLWQFIAISIIHIFIQITCYCSIAYAISVSTKNIWISSFFSVLLGVLPIINTMSNSNPLYVNAKIKLIPFVTDSCFNVITQGYGFMWLILYYLLMILIPIMIYDYYMRKMVIEYD